MNQKKMEETELHLCSKLKKLPFNNRKQYDLVFKFASLVVRNKHTGFYVVDDTLKGVFCQKALECAKGLEKVKSSISLENIDKIEEIVKLQNEIETKMEILIEKIKELKSTTPA